MSRLAKPNCITADLAVDERSEEARDDVRPIFRAAANWCDRRSGAADAAALAYALHEYGLLADGLRIVGTARSGVDDAAFRDLAMAALGEFLTDDHNDKSKLAGLLDLLAYQPLDASDLADFPVLADKLGDISRGLAIFLSTAPFRIPTRLPPSTGLWITLENPV